MALISLPDWAKKHNRAPRTVQDLIKRGRLPEAQKVGRYFVIEESTPYPADARVGQADSKTAVAVYEKTGSIRQTAKELGITEQKTRKMLITAGACVTKTSAQVLKMHEEGATVAEIAERLKISRQMVSAYLPYKKTS